ncbi:alpha/beta hydrolase [Ferrimonas aestuarii]|uniref:alpha/beta hydrolase n=1 Tax=Ferrimonas aestuarii TaxID=2569539 RepID=UPI001E55A060|nr:alpha/beta fold hydrolase [Ferrimonas aestuarii]
MRKTVLLSTLAFASSFAFADEVTSMTQIENGQKQAIELHTSVGELAANLYLPEGVDNPAVVVVTGAWTTVKEQMPATYAEALVKQGYAAVTFDFRGWGESKDAIQYLEDPSRKAEDINAVIDAVSQLDGINADKIAGLGICASSGYMLDAATANAQLKAVALVAPWLHNPEMATAIYGGEENAAALLASAKAAANSEQPVFIEAASTTNAESLMYQAPYYTETDRGLIPEYDNLYNVASWTGWLNYDALASAQNLEKPVMMVASEAMALPGGAHAYLEQSGDNIQAV